MPSLNITTPDWVKDAVFYQIFPDRFAKSNSLTKPRNLQPWGADPTFHAFQGGDLIGIVEKLDYLQELGITAIYLNPVFASASNHRYHTHDYFNVDPLLGGNDALQHLIDSAHERNIRIVLDGVFNHASRGFFQFNHLLECGAESPYVDWFHIYDWPVNAYQEHEKANFGAWWGLHALPKFNTNTPEVREFLWRVGTYWLEQGVDGWRLDVPNEIDDDAFWQEFRRRCKAVNPDVYIVGELWDEGHRWLQGDQFDAQMNYPFARLAYGFFGGRNLDQSDSSKSGLGHISPINGHQLAGGLHDMHHTYHEQVVQAQMNMMGSHDVPRPVTIANNDAKTVELMFLLQMTVAGAPNIYYGDEIGLPGRGDPDCRRAFPWSTPNEWNNSLHTKIKQYIALRQQTLALRRGDFTTLFASEHLIVFRRKVEQNIAIVAFNNNDHNHTFELSQEQLENNQLQNAIGDKSLNLIADTIVSVPARTGLVWKN